MSDTTVSPATQTPEQEIAHADALLHDAEGRIATTAPVVKPAVETAPVETLPEILKLTLVNPDHNADVAYIHTADVTFVSTRSTVLILSMKNGVSLETEDADGKLLALFVPADVLKDE